VRLSPGTLGGALAAAFLLLLLGVPLAAVVLRGLGAEPVATVQRLASDPFLRERLGLTLLQATLSTLLTVIVGLPGALAFARWSFPGKRLLRALLLIPFVMPSVVAGAGFLALAGPGGALGIDLLDTLALVLLVHVFYNHAVVVRMVGGFLESAAPRLRDAAATLGAGPWRTTLRVTLPLAAPALLAAGALVFVFCFTSFGVILIVAPGGTWDTLEVEIYRSVARLLRLDTAAALALLQLLLAMAAGGIYTALQARAAVPLGGGAPLPRPGRRGRWLLAATLLPPAVLTVAPLAALLVRAVVPPGAAGPSLAGWRAAFAPSDLLGVITAWEAAWNSLRFAAASGAVATLVGAGFAYAVVRAGWRALDRASLLPLATSAVTLGLGLLLAFPGLAGTFWGLALAHALIGTPFVARSLLPSLRGIPASRSAAAAVAGAGPWRRALRVDLPALGPGLVAGAGFAVAVSLGEFGAALVLTRPELATLPVAIYQRLGRPGAENYAAALVLALLLMVLTGLIMALLDRLGGPGEL
jgi:thiamine transport system permease protein